MSGLKVLRSGLNGLEILHDRLNDQRLGLRTCDEIVPADTSIHRDANKSEPLGYWLIRRTIRHLDLQPHDIVYDIGCGKGRPLCLFAREDITRCVGIELDPALARIAQDNIAALAGRRAEACVIQGDAASVNCDDGTVFWLFNPFGPRTLSTFVNHLKQSVEAHPRAIRLCYVTPAAEFILARSGWLHKYETVDAWPHRTGKASFWRNDV